MPYHSRIECEDVASFQTTRTRNSELWFINNPELEKAILGYAARYATRYEAKIYALAIEGNHIQNVSLFPLANRSHFMRAFNSEIKPGARPKNTKTSGPRDHRPRILSKNPERRSFGEAWYFSIYFKYRECSKRYRSGEPDVEFPKGTYKPPLFTVAYCGGIS